MPCPDCKRKAAEVLAACVAYLKMAGEEAIFTQHKQAYKNAALVVAKLQPAASDLEELLRKEGENVRKEALLDVLAFNSGLGCTPQEGYRDLGEALRDTKHLAVEKARATEEGKG